MKDSSESSLAPVVSTEHETPTGLESSLSASPKPPTSAQPARAPTEEARPSRRAALREWLWRAKAIERARQEGGARLSSEQFAHATLAREARQAARAFLWRASPKPHLALPLLRQASYWALRALHPQEDGPGLAELVPRIPRPTFEQASGHQTDPAIALLARGHFEQDAFAPMAQLNEELQLARDLTDGLLDRLDERSPGLADLYYERWSRVILVGSLLVAALCGLGWLINSATLGTDMARGKAWRASSAYGSFPASGLTDMPHAREPLFHTTHEESPWFEVDLRKARPVHAVKLINREDCCQERAVPLVVELSEDQINWTVVTRRASPFSEWTSRFPSRQARYLRVRSQLKTNLHLQGIEIY